MPKVIHFELPADDTKRAVAFYRKVFDWTITGWEGPNEYWLITAGPDDEPGINGAITPRNLPEQVTTDTIAVISVDDSLEKVEEAGGTVVMSKQVIPGVGYIAYCKDTEGNLFGILQPDMSVK